MSAGHGRKRPGNGRRAALEKERSGGKSLRSRATERPQEKEKAERGLRGGRIRSKGGKQRFRERRGGMEVGDGAAVVEARAAGGCAFSLAHRAGVPQRRASLRKRARAAVGARCRRAERPCGGFERGAAGVSARLLRRARARVAAQRAETSFRQREQRAFRKSFFSPSGGCRDDTARTT